MSAQEPLTDEQLDGEDDQEFDSRVADANRDLSSSSVARFTVDFFDIKPLGQGGFGRVFKCKKKLDNGEYAVKKIPIYVESLEMIGKVMAEVAILSKLKHESIVRYYNTWIEPKDDQSQVSENSSFADTGESYLSDEESIVPKELPSAVRRICERFEDNVLFIQMELCEKGSLRAAIDGGLLVKQRWKQIDLMIEITEGLTYLHEKNIIHRDLKPDNIFLDSVGHAKIGDFGLATTDVSAIHSSSSNKVKGTSYYRAPELDTDDGKPHTEKMDMFSFGIILFEMFYRPIRTGMERHQTLTNLRKAQFPTDSDDYCLNEIIWLVKSLVSENPYKRPSARYVLSSKIIGAQRTIHRIDKELALDRKELGASPREEFQRQKEVEDYLTIVANHLLELEFSQKKKLSDCHDQELVKSPYNHSTYGRTISAIKNTLEKVADKHVAFYCNTPTFLPLIQTGHFSKEWMPASSKSVPHFVDIRKQHFHFDLSGNIFCHPYDLRSQFVSYVNANRIRSSYCYCINKTYYRTKSVPEEKFEFVYDVVFPCNSTEPLLTPEVNLLSFINDIICEFDVLSFGQLRLRISHGSFLSNLLRYGRADDKCCIVESAIFTGAHSFEISRRRINMLNYLRERLEKLETIQTRIYVNSLLALLELSTPFMSEIFNWIEQHLFPLQECSQLNLSEVVSDSFGELVKIIEIIQEFISPRISLVFDGFIENCADFYSGFQFQLEYSEPGETSSSSQPEWTVLAFGGRYDERITQSSVGGAGFTVKVEKIIDLTLRRANSTTFTDGVLLAPLPTPGSNHKSVIKIHRETYKLATDLRLQEMNVFIPPGVITVDDVTKHCIDNLIRIAIILREEEETGARIQILMWDNNFSEPSEVRLTKTDASEIIATVKKFISAPNISSSSCSGDSSKVPCSISERDSSHDKSREN